MSSTPPPYASCPDQTTPLTTIWIKTCFFSLRPSLSVAINSNIAEDSPLFPRLGEQPPNSRPIGSMEIGRERIQSALKQAISPYESQDILEHTGK